MCGPNVQTTLQKLYQSATCRPHRIPLWPTGEVWGPASKPKTEIHSNKKDIDAEHTFDKVLSWQLVVFLAVAGKDNFGHSVFVLDQPRAYK